MEVSQLRVYSLGIVAANKALDSNIIEVTPVEDTPMADGDISDNTENLTAGAKDTDGAAYQVEVPSTVTVQAEWLPLGQANRITSPDVRRGASVVLYRFADSDKFYWNTLKNDMNLRKLETVIYGFSATQDENAKPTAENMYYLEISTHKKLVHFHTSRANGEPFMYDIQINTKEGIIIIKDDAGNSFHLNSPERQLNMTNGDNSFIDLNKMILTMDTGDQINLRTKTVNVNADTMNTTVTTINEVSELINTKSDNIVIEAETAHTGNIGQTGNFAMQGVDGTPGVATFNGTLNVTVDVVAAGISLVGHDHQDSMNGTTSPPNA